ncbi:MAG: M61 family metallopeptidase, partial [Euryarchaeota archaeon]|nr:M61 family metallopeptidase [Euryarchaeota archaeon]
GSYLIREPLAHVRDISADGASISRKAENAYRLRPNADSEEILISYELLCPDLTVRTNHLDNTHLHLVPTFTWFMPSKGWSAGSECTVTLSMPDDWSAATQLHTYPIKTPTHADWKGSNVVSWAPPNTDELYDGVIEADACPNHSRMMSAAMHHLRIWDAGGQAVEDEAVERILDSMEKLVAEFVALFGPLPYEEYWTILFLTGGARGGLEHLRSQTSMVPRKALWPQQDDAWRDLVSLLSHEYLHVWNVKRLRPKEFVEYDLSKESRTDLLWWFEGGTSWLGDIICLKSGVWSEKDWRKDLERKMKRFLAGDGNRHQSLTTSSHEAWIHLYRPHPYSRESTISYYLEGEMVMMCIDAELRKRSKGESGLETLFAMLWKRHGLDSPVLEELGIRHADIRKGLTSMVGGKRLGIMLDSLTKQKIKPNLEAAMKIFGLSFEATEKGKEKQAWLGLRLSQKNGLNVVGIQHDSCVRNILMPDDELISVDGVRLRNSSELRDVLAGKVGMEIEIMISRHNSIQQFKVVAAAQQEAKVKLVGKGNKLWKTMLESAQDS